MDKKELLKNVKMAHDELVPKGIEFAWCDNDGHVVKWKDLLELLEVVCGFATVTNEPIRGARAHGYILDEASILPTIKVKEGAIELPAGTYTINKPIEGD